MSGNYTEPNWHCKVRLRRGRHSTSRAELRYTTGVTRERKYLLAAAGLLAAVTSLKLVLASMGGLGDSEALYAVYSLHPQGGYLDHPPFVGWLIRLTTMAAGRSPLAVRLGSILLFPVTAMLVFDLARRLGGGPCSGLVAVALMCAIPITFVGGLAATPDAPAALFWVLAAWLVVRHVKDGIPDRKPLVHAAIMGLVLGLGMISKYTGVLMVVSFVAVVLSLRRRWALTYMLPALVTAAIVAIPVIVWNQENGWASFMHRLLWSQEGMGMSARNLGGLVGGQLLYMSPVIMVLVVTAMVRAWQRRSKDELMMVVALLSWIPALLLWCLCAISRVAEPHWPTLAYLPVLAVMGAGWDTGLVAGKRRLVWAGAVAALCTALGLCAAATPLATRWGLVDTRTDITNELYGWDRVAAKVRATTPPDALVVGPHWTVCAQLEWQLAGERDVSCVTVEKDDWDFWYPVRTRDPELYPRLHYVTDERFSKLDPFILTMEAVLLSKVEIERGGKVVRTFRIYRR